MATHLDPNVVGKEFDKWLDWDGTAGDSNDQYMRPTSQLTTASGLPISPISAANSDSFTVSQKHTPYTASYPNDLPTPTHSSSSPETLVNPYRLSGDTLRSDFSMYQQPTLKRKLSPNDGSEQDYKPVAGRPTGSKRPHNVIEKRYRANLNEKIAELRDSVPALRALKKAKGKQGKDGSASSDDEDLDGLTPSNKLNKASILTKAVEYIRHLEFRTRKLEEENTALKERLRVLDKVFAEGGDTAARATAFTSEEVIEKSLVSEPSSQSAAAESGPKPEVKGLIGLPESMRLMRESQPQEHYGHIYTNSSERSRLSGKWPQRIMLGSLAGLMVMEGFSESETTDESQRKALFGIPIEILDGWTFLRSPRVYLATFAQYCQAGGILPLVKGFSALTILAFLVFYYMFNSKPSSKKQQEDEMLRVPEEARPASPIEVRRRAWSTSMQALGLPHHSFFPEWFALTSEWVNYSIRYWLGPSACLWLCGETAEDETARVKAWDIAIDAQLAGGDVEVSRSRTVLTIFGSGTLPATPVRLMLKAIHTKIVLHNVGIAGSFSAKLAARIASFIADWQWRRARILHETLSPRDPERLPGYLNYLLQMDSDDVFSAKVTQRACNLMYDRPTSEGAEDTLMDVVVEDHAIKSPLDAIAAWRSTAALQEALTTAIESPHAVDLLREHIQAALEIAPPGSSAENRALAVHAVLSPGRRHAFYIRAAQALVPEADGKREQVRCERIPYFIDSSTPASARPEIAVVLRCARAMLKLEQEQDFSGALDIFSDLHWPDLEFSVAGVAIAPTNLSTGAVYFVLTRLLEASRRACDCSSSSCEDHLRPLPQLTKLAHDIYRSLRDQTLGFGLDEGLKTHFTPALELLWNTWDIRSSCLFSRRQSNASHDTGYGSFEEENSNFDNGMRKDVLATHEPGINEAVNETDALAASA